MNYIKEDNRIYHEDENHHLLAIVTFPRIKDNIVNIDHTYVDSSLRGQGIAGELMQEAASYFRENNIKARASCSYAAKWFQEHPEFSDVLDRS